MPPLPADKEPIDDETLLYRWVPREMIVEDKGLGGYRPSTECFKNTTGTDEMSVLVGDTLEAQGRNPLELLEVKRSAGSLKAGFVRDHCGKLTARTPKRDEPQELAHGSVIGPNDKKEMRRMAREILCIEHDGDWEKARAMIAPDSP